MKIRIDTPIARLTADLTEDQVTDLLRIALEYATGGDFAAGPAIIPPKIFIPDPDKKPQEIPDAGPNTTPKITFPTEPDKKPQETRTVAPGYKGFLYVKCEACGEVKGFCVKSPIFENRCRCGQTTALRDMKPLFVNCKCGESFKYHTNITDPIATINCIKCGAPVDLQYHDKKGIYETIDLDRRIDHAKTRKHIPEGNPVLLQRREAVHLLEEEDPDGASCAYL